MSTQSSERNNMDSKQEFKLFANLPIELRKMIWHLTLEPRTVTLSFDTFWFGACRGFFTYTPPPTALHVCRDSREAVVKSYPLCFGPVFDSSKIRFNFDIDTLFLDDYMDPHYALFFSAMRIEDLTRIKRLAFYEFDDNGGFGFLEELHYQEGGYSVHKPNILCAIVPQMKSLEEIYEAHTIWRKDGDLLKYGEGPKQLFETLPKGLPVDYDDDWDKFPPIASRPEDSSRKKIAGVQVTPIWGWSPTEEWLEYGCVKDI